MKGRPMRLSWNLDASLKKIVYLLPLLLLGNGGLYFYQAQRQVVLEDLRVQAPHRADIEHLMSKRDFSKIASKDLKQHLKVLLSSHHLEITRYSMQEGTLPGIQIDFAGELDTDVYDLVQDLEGHHEEPYRIVSLGLFKKPGGQGIQGQLKLQVWTWS